MSIEYTIDIQLTEMGFPDVLPPRETEVKRDVKDDTDGSDGSDVYDEEEIDEEDDHEEANSESSHSGDFCCSVCDLHLPSQFKLQDHMNLHTGARPYCCAECGKRFSQIYNYQVHLRTHAQTKLNPLMCRICRISFASQDDLKHHLSRTHFEKEFYECDFCKHVFTSMAACEHHVQIHKCLTKIKCEICGRHFSSPDSLTRHRKRLCHRVLKCTDCTKTFTKKNALLKHSFSHLGLLPYTCIRCRCHFRLAKLYRQHKCQPQRIHCVACLREFLSQEEFQQHKKDTGCWGNQEPKTDEIRCLECGERFDTSDELKKHAGAHQRVLKCAECGKGFRSALLLMSHMGGHAGKSPCLCQRCGRGFPHQQNYDSHLKTCGQTPQPVSVPKKHQALKRSSPKTKEFNRKPDSSNPKKTVALPAAPVNEGVSTGSIPSDGLWKLTLDKQPPPGAKLLLFLPVCPTPTHGQTLPSIISPKPPDSAIKIEPQHFGASAALGPLLNVPLNFVPGIKQDTECEAPLDLSKKSFKSTRNDINIKSEPRHFESCEEAVTQNCKSNDCKIFKANPGEFEMDAMDLYLSEVNTMPSPLIIDVKEEPKSPARSPDL
ncbi:zinc finger protein ZFP2 [Antennarius striatus]|uniref:zinc finger protein ZFP2 n=1 Tax=Antennarius striatus TaxID=241820 RepID=UPI0035B067C0